MVMHDEFDYDGDIGSLTLLERGLVIGVIIFVLAIVTMTLTKKREEPKQTDATKTEQTK
jgi:hypothetical protein